MQVNGIVALLKSHQFDLARSQWLNIEADN